MATTAKSNKSIIAALLTAAAASLCCITPVLAFLGGVSGIASSFSWIEPFRPYLIGLTIFLFAFAWYQKLKPQKQVDCNCEPGKKAPFWNSRAILGILTVLAGLLVAFPYYAKAFYPKPTQPHVIIAAKSDIKQAEFKIKGMTCEGCTEHVNSQIAKIKGVINYQTSYVKGNSIVKFDNSKTSVDTIAKAINNTGYKVTSQNLANN
ncbi:MAG: mercuric transport protein MerTP [Flavisolibacter sp.]